MTFKQGDFFDDPVPVHRDPTPTEIEAKRKTEKEISGFRLDVLNFVKQAGERGVTGAEACWMFPTKTESAVRTRLTELWRKYNLIVRTSDTRPNLRGNNELVWVATEFITTGEE